MFASLLCGLLLAAPPQDPVQAARAWHRDHGPAILGEFAEFLRLPNVASDLPNIERNVSWMVAAFAERGVVLEPLRLDGVPPLVVGSRQAPGAARTLGVYVHYDGQPVDPARWEQPPWEATLYTDALEEGGRPRPLPAAGEALDPRWRLYGRSAADDKAPIVALLAAIDALAAARLDWSANLVLMFEGEEEAGSPHLEQYLERHGERFEEVDLWLICDGPIHPSRRPQLVFGVRGITSFELTVYGAERPLHSGHYGNWAPNPGMALSRLLAGMKDAHGRVTIDGFYEDVVPLDEAERAALARLPDIEEDLLEELGLAEPEGMLDLRHAVLHPSLNVRGLESAAVGEDARNIIPSTATAAIDVRLPKGCVPERMLDRIQTHIESEGWHVVEEEPDHATRRSQPKLVRMRRGPGYPAARTRLDTAVVQPVVQAVRRVTREDALMVPSLGGSLPLHLFTETLGKPVVIVPMANHDDLQHAPNENLRIAELQYGIELMAAVLTMPPG